MIRISEAAKRLGVSPATLRRWERDGLITARRTPGGERRYDVADLDDLAQREAFQRRSGAQDSSAESINTLLKGLPDDGSDDQFKETREPSEIRAPGSAVPPWEVRVHEARADLEVAQLLREKGDVDHEESLAVSGREQKRRADLQAMQAAKASEKIRLAEKERLETLLTYAEMLVALSGAPLEYRMRATRELSSFVTPEQFPATLNLVEGYAYVKGKVDQIVAPWRKKLDDEKRLETLVLGGRSHAERGTAGWDRKEAERAKREVERALQEEIKTAWSQEDVADLVDEILDQWEE